MNLVDSIEQAYLLESATHKDLIREAAYQNFQQLGIPSTRDEEWKYTPIKQALNGSVVLKTTTPSSTLPEGANLFTALTANKLVFINGVFSKEHSVLLDTTLEIGSIKEYSSSAAFAKYYNQIARNKTEHFSALNTAFAPDGAFVFIQQNAVVEHPILLLYLFDEQAAHSFLQTRNLIVAEQGAEVKVVEDFQCFGEAIFYNHLSEVFVGQNASVQYAVLQTANKYSTSINTLEVDQQKDSRFSCTTITLDGDLVRNNWNVSSNGEGADSHLYGLYLGNGNRLIDSHLLIDHRVPNCSSNQLYKGILDEESTGIFNGKVFVQQDAQKTNAFQSSKAILLSDTATVNSKPQLEIFADDVKCSHGAAIGQLNDTELFYMQARGLEKEEARAILTYAFAREIIDNITLSEISEYVDAQLKQRLGVTF